MLFCRKLLALGELSLQRLNTRNVFTCKFVCFVDGETLQTFHKGLVYSTQPDKAVINRTEK